MCRLVSGAFASVCLCEYRGTLVAVKYLKTCLLQSDEDLKCFLSEAALLKKLRHSSIVDFVGVAIEPAVPDESGSTSQPKTLQKSYSAGQRAADVLLSAIRLKRAKSAVGNPVTKKGSYEEDKSDAASTEGLSCPIKKAMIIQEYMTRGTLKSMILHQMEHAFKMIYTREQALEWLIQIAQGLK